MSKRLFLLAAIASAAIGVAARDDEGRDEWQRPGEVMDALGVAPGSVVADVGCGEGYFSFHLATRVGPEGRVYAVDIADADLARVRRRAEEAGLAQIETILGSSDDPRLPLRALDAALIVNAYHEMSEQDAMLRGLHRALKPGGRLAIIDHEDEEGMDRSTYRGRHRLPKRIVEEDARRNGFRFEREAPGFVKPRRGGETWYFLIFVKEA